MVSLAVFLICYLLFFIFSHWRSYIALAGVVVLLGAGVLSFHEMVFELINWNVVSLFFGTLILAELFMQSRMPAVLAEWCVDKTTTVRGALIAVCALSSLLSMFVENVAVVLLVAPIVLSLCEKLKVNPIQPMILMAMFSNLQGTATLIGDPPSMILGGYMKLNFNDFFFYQGRPGIFFVVQAGFIAALLVAFYLLRGYKQPISLLSVEKPKSLIPSFLLILFVVLLAFSTYFDPDFKWFAGSLALLLAALGLVWHHYGPRWSDLKTLVTELDWDTTLFLAALFVIVGALERGGWIDALSHWLETHLSSNIFVTYVMIIFLSTAISAFVDNVPFLLTMLPVAKNLANSFGSAEPLFMFALLVGACLGGNISPLGASANIVTLGILKKQGHVVSWPEFIKTGLAFTIAAVSAGGSLLWYLWA